MQSEMKKVFDAVINENRSQLKLKRAVNKLGDKVANGSHMAFLSVANEKSRAYVIKGSGRNVRNAIYSAIDTYLEHKPNKFKPTSLKIDILTSYEPIKQNSNQFNLIKDKIQYDRGLDGIAFGNDFHTVFLPGEITGYRIIRRRKIHI